MLFFISKHTKDYEKIGVATTDTVDTFPDLVSPQHLADKIGLYVPRRAVSNTLRPTAQYNPTLLILNTHPLRYKNI